MVDNQATHLYLVLQGSYVGAALAGEVWQTGVRFALRPGLTAPIDVGPFVPFGVVATNHNIIETDWTITGNWTTEMGVSDFNPADWLNDQVAQAAIDFLKAGIMATSVQLDSLLVYPIRSPDGKAQPAIPYSQGSPIRCDYSGTRPVGIGGTGAPLQISCAAGLRTAQVGRRGRGRMFLPQIASVLMPGGTFTTGNALTIAGTVKDFLEACRTDGSGPGGVWCAPCVTGAPFSEYALINQCRVDTIPDTQNRRRRSLATVPQNVTVTPV